MAPTADKRTTRKRVRVTGYSHTYRALTDKRLGHDWTATHTDRTDPKRPRTMAGLADGRNAVHVVRWIEDNTAGANGYYGTIEELAVSVGMSRWTISRALKAAVASEVLFTVGNGKGRRVTIYRVWPSTEANAKTEVEAHKRTLKAAADKRREDRRKAREDDLFTDDLDVPDDTAATHVEPAAEVPARKVRSRTTEATAPVPPVPSWPTTPALLDKHLLPLVKASEYDTFEHPAAQQMLMTHLENGKVANWYWRGTLRPVIDALRDYDPSTTPRNVANTLLEALVRTEPGNLNADGDLSAERMHGWAVAAADLITHNLERTNAARTA